jgi:histidyl-tRNA synthetase
MHASASADGSMGSMKSQFKRADGSGAAYALVFGDEELARDVVSIKSLRDGAGAQVEQSLATVSLWAGNLQSRPTN